MIGLGVFDALAREIVDPDTGDIYPALTSFNSPEMASRCAVLGADKVIWTIKASAQFNSDCAFLLREGFRSGRIRLLETEYDAEESLKLIKGYSTLNPPEQIAFRLPYIHTTLLIDELTKLQHEESGGKVKIYERSNMRKDRYSSLSYNYYVAVQLENKFSRRQSANISSADMFLIKPPNYTGKAVNRISGREGATHWN